MVTSFIIQFVLLFPSAMMYIIHKVVLISGAFLLVNCQHNPNFNLNRRAIVQLFEWKFVDIAHECETFLGKNNFAGVQVKLSALRVKNLINQ